MNYKGMYTKRKRVRTGVLVSLGIMLAGLYMNVLPSRAEEAKGIKVQYHTQEEIKDYIKKHNISMDQEIKYTQKPSTKSPYQPGKLTTDTLNGALQTLNAMRYIAGIDDNVILNESYIEKAQAAALVNAINDDLSHNPSRPANMSDDLYELGLSGAGNSNLAWGVGSLNETIISLWMEDGDSGNIDRVGHRRWILNPKLGQTGFGAVDTYTSLYCINNSNREADYYGVAWPAQNMPIDYFDSYYPWSISMGEKVDSSSVKVVLKRVGDGKTWTFSENSADGYFNVNNAGYGQTGCIIFRPKTISYNDGDIFQVSISGLEQEVSYTVSFFGLNEITDIKLKKTSYVYDGKQHTPEVVVKDASGKKIAKSNYTVKYSSGRKKVGNYQVTVTMNGKYSGEKTLTFSIVPKGTSVNKLVAAKKGFSVSYSQVKNVSGYEIAYSTKSNFSKATTKTKKITSGKKTTVKVKGCKANKKYYVKIRSYQKVKFQGKQVKLYSKWSKVKQVKTQ